MGCLLMESDRIQHAIAILRMQYEPENDPDYHREKMNFMSLQICAALEALEGRA